MCRKLCYLISFVLLLGLVVTSTAEAVGDPNLVAYWKMDESWGNIAADVAGHDYDAELGDDRFSWEKGARLLTWRPTDGNVGGAVQFGDANHCYITAQDMDDANLYPEPIDGSWPDGTVATWLKLTDPQPLDRRDSNMRFAHGTGSGGRRRIWFVGTTDPTLRDLNIGMGGNLYWKQGGIKTLTLETWHHVAITWVGQPDGVGRVYVDGNDATYANNYTAMDAFMSNVVIGNSSTGSQGPGDGSQSFCGFLDDVAIWNIAKTEPEIVAIFNTGITQPTFTRATEPNPARGDFDVGAEPNNWPDPNLGWIAGISATSHDVYFGTDHNGVRDAPISDANFFMGNQSGTDFDSGVLAMDETYYWRIDEQPGPVKGRVWSFTTDDGKATDPIPEDDDTPSGQDETAPDANLNWFPGAFADTHEIYLGTDRQDVNIADKLSAVYMGTDAVPCAHDANRVCYDPGGLTLGATYYWRIDESNSVYGTARGDVWGFRVLAHLTVDDFEPYTSSGDLQVPWKIAKNAHNVLLKQTVENGADDSNQYMEMTFVLTTMSGYTPPYYAEAWRSVLDPDFTGGGFAKALAVSYMASSSGGSTSDFGEMYVRLEDGSGGDTDTVTLTDPNLDALWHEWNIDLRDFNNVNLDMTDISKIHIGIGDNTDRGWGYAYFDEIRLYAIRCMDELLDPPLRGDINGDCEVDFDDVENMGEDWLESDYNSVGWDGFLDPDAFLPPGGWVIDPCRGNSLAFDGHEDTPDDSNDWLDIDDYALPDFQNRTVAVWVKNDSNDQESQYRVNIFSSHSDYWIEMSIGAGGTREGLLEFRLSDDDSDLKWQRLANSTLDVNEWHHAAFTIANRTDDPNFVYCELLLDGVVIESGNAATEPAGADLMRHEDDHLRGANIGSYNEGERRFIQATLDDFRIYDHNLPVQDISEIYLGTDGAIAGDANLIIWYKFDETSGDIADDSGRDKDLHIYHAMQEASNIVEKDPPGPPYDPDNKDIVNFLDYAALADDWLVKRLWPEP